MTELQLYIGRKNTGIMIWQDPRWIGAWGGSGMWRVIMPDGRVSDMVNLPRAKDAAIAASRPDTRGGYGYSRRVVWKGHAAGSRTSLMH